MTPKHNITMITTLQLKSHSTPKPLVGHAAALAIRGHLTNLALDLDATASTHTPPPPHQATRAITHALTLADTLVQRTGDHFSPQAAASAAAYAIGISLFVEIATTALRSTHAPHLTRLADLADDLGHDIATSAAGIGFAISAQPPIPPHA